MDDPQDHGGLSPLAVLLAVMREKWAAGEPDEAAKVARVAAPYVHARASRQANKEPSAMTDAELAEALASLQRLHGSAS